MPPKKEKKSQPNEEKKPQPPHPAAIDSARKMIENVNGKGKVNNSIFTRSLQGLTMHAKDKKIVNSYRKTQKLVANEKAAEIAAELERTGGIDIHKELEERRKMWDNNCQKHFSGKGYITSKNQQKLIDEINNTFERVGKSGSGWIFSIICNQSGHPDTNKQYEYAVYRLMADIINKEFDDRLEQLYNVVSDAKAKKDLASEKADPIIRAIEKRKEMITTMSAPGGGAGSEGGARRRRTHKRKTHRRKTHKRRH